MPNKKKRQSPTAGKANGAPSNNNVSTKLQNESISVNKSKNTSQRSILTAEQERELEYVQANFPSKRALLERTYTGESKADAIKANCLECSGWSSKEVKLCPVSWCALWKHRPFQTRKAVPHD